MREDMAQVIVERPRHGGGVKYPRGSARNTDRVSIEEWHKREAIRRPWQSHSWQKGLNENLAPLRRFIRSRLGRPWDKVYGEICERINRDSAVQLHIWQHLVQFVCTNPYEVTGDVHRRWWSAWAAFYVDPRSGLLRERRHKRKPSAAELAATRIRLGMDTIVPIDDGRCYDRIKELWYELELRDRPANGKVYDVAARRELSCNDRGAFRRYRGRDVYVARKRQLNTKEIRRVEAAIARSGRRRAKGGIIPAP